jgi:HD-GYP domain-containing protein (c-di-GMP phosphodiesterase class II)
VSVAHLYPREHPRLVELIERVSTHVQGLAGRAELSVLSIDGKLIVDGRALSAGDHLARGLFATLERCGYHRVTFRRGLKPDEVYDFVHRVACAKRGGADEPTLRSTEHLRLAALEGVHHGQDAEGLAPAAFDTQPLADAWGGILDNRGCNLEAIEYVVLALARTIDKHAGGLIPLAALREHDEYTVMHITNVALLSMALAETIGLPAGTVNEIGVAALLHDMGKLRVPSEILNAPGRLNAEQAAIVKRHPEDGTRILLAASGAPELAAVVAYEHHMQFDGGGYPTAPRRWKLNLASAITTIADVYDALRSERPYRAGLSRAQIRAIMTKDSGTVFAPDLLQVFLDHVEPRTQATSSESITDANTLSDTSHMDRPRLGAA